MEEAVQSNQPGNLTCSRAPVPRKKVTVSLTASQAEMLRSLWQEHSAALHAMLKGWCGDAQNASDILQEVFRRLAESPAVMTRVKNARAFLAVSARRIAVDFARRSKTRSAYQTAAGVEAPTVENPGPTDENLRTVIVEALNGLPAEQRSVFEHKILNGRTLEEIARLEGVSLNTVSSRLRYALDKIRGQLRPYYDDLNRKDFKNMKNDPANPENIASRRIITPLAPKRVPSVAPGLEGLAAMAPDACEAAPEIEVSAPEFVEAAPAVEFLEPEIANCGVGGNAWEQTIPDAVELPAIEGEGSPSEVAEDSGEVVVAEEIPEMISCEVLPEGGIPEEWLRPISIVESSENFLVTPYEGESGSGTEDGADLAGEGEPVGEEAVPEEFTAEFDPNELLIRYNEFLRENPDWDALDPDVMEAQVVTPSRHFAELEFGTQGKAAAFDSWYETFYAQADNGGVADDSAGGELGEGGAPPFDVEECFQICICPELEELFAGSEDPDEMFARFEEFLRQNPDWCAPPDSSVEFEVITNIEEHISEPEPLTPIGGPYGDSDADVVPAQPGSVPSSGILIGGENTDGNAGGDPPKNWPGLPPGTSLLVGGDGIPNGGTTVNGGTPTSAGGIPPHPGGSVQIENGFLQLNAGNSYSGTGAIPGTGLALSGGVSQEGGVPTLGEASQIVVTGGTLGTNEPLEQVGDNTLTLSNGSKVVLEGGQVISNGNVYAFSPEVGSDNKVPDTERLAEVAGLPTEVAISDTSAAEAALSFGNAAAGLAPTSGEALIVEFGVLSPSEAPHASQVSTLSRPTNDFPQANFSSGGSTFAAINPEGLSAAQDVSAPDDALQHVTASAQQSAPASSSGTKVDAPTATAGAVAAGTVVHGGAAAPAIRRPLFKA